MYCFLAIVAEQDQKRGEIFPSYILCQSHGFSENRSGWRVIRQDDDNSLRNMPKVLVTSLYGNEAMIDFLRSYRTRDHMHGDRHYKKENTMKYYPKGALFWFSCDIYGRPDGLSIFIERIPQKRKRETADGGFRRLKAARARVMPIQEKLSREPRADPLETSVVKPKLVQRKQ